MVKTESYIAEQNPIAGDQHVQLLQTADQEKCLTTIPNGLHVVPIPELVSFVCAISVHTSLRAHGIVDQCAACSVGYVRVTCLPASSIVSRPRPAFCHLQYVKVGRAWYLFSHEHDVIDK